jgi:nitronate monooxygenase
MAIRHGSPAPLQDETRGDRGFVEERRGSLRMLLNDFAIGMLAERSGGIAFEEALNTPGASEESPESNRTVSAFVFGDLENNAISAGQGSGMINDIPSCRELIQRMIGEAEPILERLNAIASRSTA